jgi:hypothetical protein
MKRILSMTMIIGLFSIAAARAQMLRDVAPTAGAHHPNAGILDSAASAGVVMAQFNRDIVKAFRAAWYQAAKGRASVEAVILITRNPDGSCKAVLPDSTHQHYRFTFHWLPGTIAVVHTHPNDHDPRPAEADIDIAERFRVPMFTLTNTGMFLYDPATKITSRVQHGTDWLVNSKWRRYRR